MSNYPFTQQEQDSIRELGRLGFRYEHETKKAIEFSNDARSETIYLNRELQQIALVFGFGDAAKIPKHSGITISTLPRSSSNFPKLKTGLTSRGIENHQGAQCVFERAELISTVVNSIR